MKGGSFVMYLGYNVSQAHYKKVQKMNLEKRNAKE